MRRCVFAGHCVLRCDGSYTQCPWRQIAAATKRRDVCTSGRIFSRIRIAPWRRRRRRYGDDAITYFLRDYTSCTQRPMSAWTPPLRFGDFLLLYMMFSAFAYRARPFYMVKCDYDIPPVSRFYGMAAVSSTSIKRMSARSRLISSSVRGRSLFMSTSALAASQLKARRAMKRSYPSFGRSEV